MTERGDMTVTRRGDATLVIRLSGAWRLETGIPPFHDLERELATAGAKTVAFESSELRRWDSAVVAFIARVIAACRERHVTVDVGGLPAGVRRLLRLAEAVPENPGTRRVEASRSWIERIGSSALGVVAGGEKTLAFLGDVTMSAGRLLRGRARVRAFDLTILIQECGAHALPIVTLISVLVGMILAFVGAVQLQRFGAQLYVADLVAIAMVREMGCIMTGIIMAGRTGSGFAAEIGTMKVTQELDALATLGISPVDFLVLPRIVALSAMMPLLCAYSDLLGILGGGLVSVGMLDLTASRYLHETATAITLKSYWMGIGKSIVFGVLVALAGCLRGVQCAKTASGVGDAATSAVVTGIVLIIVADGVFAVVFHVLGI